MSTLLSWSLLVLLVGEIPSATGQQACTSGFISWDDLMTLAPMGSTSGNCQVCALDREQRLIPDMSFTCNGNVTKWIFGARFDSRRDGLPELQIWRRDAVSQSLYTMVGSSTPNADSESGSRVYEYTLDPPLQFEIGDILGILQPAQPAQSRLSIYYDDGSGPVNYVRSSSSADSTFNIAGVSQENALPLVTMEIFTVVGCGMLNNPENGQVTQTGTTEGSTATYSCNTGYSLMGVSMRTCQSDGMWSDQPPVCTREMFPSSSETIPPSATIAPTTSTVLSASLTAQERSAASSNNEIISPSDNIAEHIALTTSQTLPTSSASLTSQERSAASSSSEIISPSDNIAEHIAPTTSQTSLTSSASLTSQEGPAASSSSETVSLPDNIAEHIALTTSQTSLTSSASLTSQERSAASSSSEIISPSDNIAEHIAPTTSQTSLTSSASLTSQEGPAASSSSETVSLPDNIAEHIAPTTFQTSHTLSASLTAQEGPEAIQITGRKDDCMSVGVPVVIGAAVGGVAFGSLATVLVIIVMRIAIVRIARRQKPPLQNEPQAPQVSEDQEEAEAAVIIYEEIDHALLPQRSAHIIPNLNVAYTSPTEPNTSTIEIDSNAVYSSSFSPTEPNASTAEMDLNAAYSSSNIPNGGIDMESY